MIGMIIDIIMQNLGLGGPHEPEIICACGDIPPWPEL